MTKVFEKSFLHKLSISPRKKISLNVRGLVLDAIDEIARITKVNRTDVIESILMNYIRDYIKTLQEGLAKGEKLEFKEMFKELKKFENNWGK